MEEEFVDYREALELKELGFDEPCLGYYAGDILCTGQPQEIHLDKDGNYKKTKTDSYPIIAAPTYSQAFRWFREKYKLYVNIESQKNEMGFWGYVTNSTDYLHDVEVKIYEEAELVCLKKLIEIVKEKLWKKNLYLTNKHLL